jgi:ribonuclease P protein component
LKDIELLFGSNHSFKVFPLRILFEKKYPRTSGIGVSTLISVPKKKFKKAVQRNRIKRLIREVYRLNKGLLISSQKETDYDLLVGFIYLGQGICDFRELEPIMQNALVILKEKLL